MKKVLTASSTLKLMATKAVVAAHDQKTTIHIVEHYPPHEPRASDVHYHFFNEARRRLEKAKLMKCWIGNHECGGGIELHHNLIEYSLQNGVDIRKFETLYPEFELTTDDQFAEWIEGGGKYPDRQLLPLCVAHHRGRYGIHCVPFPNWICARFEKTGFVPVQVCK